MIRQATLTDANDIARIHVETWRVAYKGIVPDTYLSTLSVEQRKNSWHNTLLKSTSGTLLSVNDRQTTIGWISFGPSRDADGNGLGEIYAVYLNPDSWGVGAGFQLMKAAECSLNELGFCEYTLWVLELNKRAINFYKKLGYRRDDKIKQHNFDGKIHNEIRYRKYAEQGHAAEPT